MIFNVRFSYLFSLLLQYETHIKMSRLLDEDFLLLKGLKYSFICPYTLHL